MQHIWWCFFQIMIDELLTMQVLPRLKVSIWTVSGTYSLRLRSTSRYLWIGLDWVICKLKLWTSRLNWIVPAEMDHAETRPQDLVAFPFSEAHRPSNSTNLCTVTQVRVLERLAQGGSRLCIERDSNSRPLRSQVRHSPIRSCRIRCLPVTTVVQTTSAWTLAGARDLCVLAGWRKVQTLHPALLLDGWTWQLWCTIHGHPPENPFPGGHVVSSFKRSMNHRYGREFPINVTNGVSTTKWHWNKNSFRTVLKLFCFSFISLCGRSRIWNTLSDN